MPRKMFNKRLYDENDRITKNFVIKWLPSLLAEEYSNLFLCENGDKYGIDLVGVDDDHRLVGIEVEHKLESTWTEEFPYDCVRIPERKKKFITEGRDIWFVVVNHNFTRLCLIPSYNIPEETVIVNNKYAKREKFFAVPAGNCRWFRTEEREERDGWQSQGVQEREDGAVEESPVETVEG